MDPDTLLQPDAPNAKPRRVIAAEPRSQVPPASGHRFGSARVEVGRLQHVVDGLGVHPEGPTHPDRG